MPHYYANFQSIGSYDFRFDTRIYLDLNSTPGPHDKCVAAVIGKNPGSASPITGSSFRSPLVQVQGDQTLDTIKKRFLDAYIIARKPIPENGYVVVWNLFYMCQPGLKTAIADFRTMRNPPGSCKTESDPKLDPKIIWYAWGPSDRFLDTLKDRFVSLGSGRTCFFEHGRSVKSGVPLKAVTAHHPLYSIRDISRHLASLI